MDPLPSHHQAGGGDISDGGEWKQGSAWGGRIPLLTYPTFPGALIQIGARTREMRTRKRRMGMKVVLGWRGHLGQGSLPPHHDLFN